MSFSTSHSTIQGLEREAAALTVEKLKTVLRHTNLPVSGTKSILISRITDELGRLSGPGQPAGPFERLCQLIQNPDKPQSLAAAGNHTPYSSRPFAASPRFGSHSNGRSGTDAFTSSSQFGPSFGYEMTFTDSPFHEIIEKIHPRMELDPRENTRDTKEIKVKIKEETLKNLREDKQLRILLYCATDDSLSGPAHVTFPNSFELRINNEEVRGNFRGLKNKPGTTRPADVTDHFLKGWNHDFKVFITWALTHKRYNVLFQLVRTCEADALVSKLREAKSISKASVLQEMNNWNSDSDIVATSSRMSLKCPLSTLRIQTPCRSKRCRHNQCFDALSFLQLQQQAPQWSCPVCNQHVPFDILQVDEYVDDILKNSPPSAEQVTVDPSGKWSLVAEKGDGDNQSDPAVKREGTDISDDIVEISGPTNGIPMRTPSTSFSPFVNDSIRGSIEPAATGMSNPPAPKRPAAAVIDLTGDSDEDEDLPIRPPKRQHTASQAESTWSQSVQHAGFMPNPVKFTMSRPRSSLPSDPSYRL